MPRSKKARTEVKFVRNYQGGIVGFIKREELPFKEAKKKFGHYKEWKEFERRYLARLPNPFNILITKEEWDKLKAGDRLISPGGTIRWIVNKETHRSNMVTFKKHMMNGYRSHFTCYCYNDLKRQYSVYHKKPTPSEKREFIKLLKEYGENDRRLFPHTYIKKGKKWVKKIF